MFRKSPVCYTVATLIIPYFGVVGLILILLFRKGLDQEPCFGTGSLRMSLFDSGEPSRL